MFITKKKLMKLLESVPDDALGVYFSGDESSEFARDLLVFRPGDEDYYKPECMKGRPKVWFELGRKW